MEDALYRWWFNTNKLIPFKILDFGEVNTTDGPDLSGIVIEWNGTRYKGNAELDISSTNWILHGHFQNSLYHNTLLQIVDHHHLQFYHGFIPQFLYVISTRQFEEIVSTEHFTEKRIRFIKQYEKLYSKPFVFQLLFARALGYFHNRELMTYAAIIQRQLQKLAYEFQLSVLLECVFPKKRQIRPNNRVRYRLKQYLTCVSDSRLDVCNQAIKQRFRLAKLVNELYLLLNRSLTEPIGKQRIEQWLFNAVIPFELYYSSPNDLGYKSYLYDLFEHLQTRPSLRKFHEGKIHLELPQSLSVHSRQNFYGPSVFFPK